MRTVPTNIPNDQRSILPNDPLTYKIWPPNKDYWTTSPKCTYDQRLAARPSLALRLVARQRAVGSARGTGARLRLAATFYTEPSLQEGSPSCQSGYRKDMEPGTLCRFSQNCVPLQTEHGPQTLLSGGSSAPVTGTP